MLSIDCIADLRFSIASLSMLSRSRECFTVGTFRGRNFTKNTTSDSKVEVDEARDVNWPVNEVRGV